MPTKPTYIPFLACLNCVFLIVSSCTSDSPENIERQKIEMSFAVSGDSRASINPPFDNFAVYGDRNEPATANAPIVIFDKTKVESTNSGWTYEGTLRYWFPEHEHSFVALYPPAVLKDENKPEYSNSKLSFTYTLPTDEDDWVKSSELPDILAATHRRLSEKKTTDPKITLSFGHLLSLINISFELNDASMGANEYFKIHKFEMSGFGTSAEINIKPSSIQTGDRTDVREIEIKLNTSESNGRLAIDFKEPIKVTNQAEAVKMFDDSNAIILLPQVFGANDNVQFGLTYSVNEEENTTQAAASLSGFTWDSGKSYSYKIKVNNNNQGVLSIESDTIEPWTLIESTESIDAW